MEVLLLEEVPGKGAMGEIIRVKTGYFRNYLGPRQLAVPATEENHKVLEERHRQLRKRAARELQNAQAIAEELGALTLTFRLKAGENDRLFGSVTNSDIAQSISQHGLVVDRRKIILDEPIKSLGLFTVHARLAPEVEARIKVLVEKK